MLSNDEQRIVDWLREQPKLVPLSPDHVCANSPQILADSIERGDHRKDK